MTRTEIQELRQVLSSAQADDARAEFIQTRAQERKRESGRAAVRTVMREGFYALGFAGVFIAFFALGAASGLFDLFLI